MKYNQRGFSIIELLVGILVSLWISLTIISTFQVIETQKKITLDSNDIINNLSYAYRELTTNIKMSGYGVNECSSINFTQDVNSEYPDSNNGVTDKLFKITNNSNSDDISATFAVSDTGIAYSSIDSISGNTFIPKYKHHITNSGLVLSFINSNNTNPCSLAAVSDISGNTITIGNTFKEKTLTSTISDSNSKVRGFSDFKNVTYSIDANNNLVEKDLFSKTTNIIANNIAAMKAYYGTDTNSFLPADTTIDTKYIVSVRIILIARSSIKRTKVNGVCTTTLTEPISGADGTKIKLNHITDWDCYKYKQIDSIIPLKNLNKIVS